MYNVMYVLILVNEHHSLIIRCTIIVTCNSVQPIVELLLNDCIPRRSTRSLSLLTIEIILRRKQLWSLNMMVSTYVFIATHFLSADIIKYEISYYLVQCRSAAQTLQNHSLLIRICLHM